MRDLIKEFIDTKAVEGGASLNTIKAYMTDINQYMEDEKKSAVRFEFARGMGLRKNPAFASQCIGCDKCEKHCPQHLPIREKLREADRDLRPDLYKIGINIARKIMIR